MVALWIWVNWDNVNLLDHVSNSLEENAKMRIEIEQQEKDVVSSDVLCYCPHLPPIFPNLYVNGMSIFSFALFTPYNNRIRCD